MTPRAYQLIQNLLVTAITVVLALVVWAAFLRVIRDPDPSVVAQNEALREFATTVVPFPGGPAATTVAPQGVGEGDGTATTAPGPACREEPPEAGAGTVLRVYYTCGPSTVPAAASFVYRVVSPTNLVLTNTIAELVRGPDGSERALGFVSFFSSDTTDALGDLTLNAGRATIEFRGLDDINNISTSSGSEFFLANLNANVFQFDTIEAVEYRLNGSCDEFWNLLQRDCQLMTRAEWERQLTRWASEG